jgi:4-diphosphocytidyl-2-C-methyl-D-erythritol kinase
MIFFPNCKINIGLYVTEKRNDGYHNIETIFQPVALTDIVEAIVPSTTLAATTITTTGLPITGDANSNLCSKAFHLLQAQYPQIKNVQLHLHKIIPMGAGLGGGSANGAFTLLLLNKLFQLQLTKQQLIDYALQLGSDCPFFIINQTCFATGRGELLTPISIGVKNYTLVIVNPQIHISTAWAFSNITPKPVNNNLQEAIQQPIETWQHTIVNQFEAPAIQQYPEIGSIKNYLYLQGAVYASMSGTGSTVYGIFKQAPTLHFPNHYFVHTNKLLSNA